MSDYRPIDRALYDRYAKWAAQGTELRITHRAENGIERISQGRITELRNDGAEWLVLASGETIRLDRIVRMDDVL